MQKKMSHYGRELDAAVRSARAGGAIVKEFYDQATATTYAKGDGSPVTDADLAADRVIQDILHEAFPDDAVLTEEGQDDLTRLKRSRCWIVDPVDGTEQFIARTGEFDVLIALVEEGRPVAVAGFQPTTNTLVTATVGGGARLQVGNNAPEPITLVPPENGVRLATSKWFGAPGNREIMSALAHRIGCEPGSALVTGFTPRMFLSPRGFDVMVGVRAGDEQRMASEWDFAVNDLVISEAGGMVTDLAGTVFRYNKERPINDGGLVAAVDPRTHARVLEALQFVRGA